MLAKAARCWLIDWWSRPVDCKVAKEDHAQAKEGFTTNTDIIDGQGHARTGKEKENMGDAGCRLPYVWRALACLGDGFSKVRVRQLAIVDVGMEG